jgi:hypothetical protein
MADASIIVQGIVLYDNWPGRAQAPPKGLGNIEDMTCAAVGHNQATAMWPLGTKWQLYCKGDAVSVGVSFWLGWSSFVYLKCADDIETAVLGAVTVLAVPDGTLAAGMAHDRLYTVTTDSDSTTHETMGLVAMCLGTMTNSYYGWFWCGGVAPIEYVPGLLAASTVVTDDSLYSAATVTEIGTVASAATGIGFRAQPTASQVPACGEALWADS